MSVAILPGDVRHSHAEGTALAYVAVLLVCALVVLLLVALGAADRRTVGADPSAKPILFGRGSAVVLAGAAVRKPILF